MFKVNYQTEDYVQSSYISRGNRSALAKFRTGVALPPPPPLRVETGRYEALQLNQQVCFNCKNLVQGERHVLIDCPIYEPIRSDLYAKALSVNNSFMDLSDAEKMCFLLSNDAVVQYTAKACSEILKHRQTCIYK